MIETLNQIAAPWWQWMSAMFWQVSLLIVIITLIDMAIRKRAWPQVRYALWLLVLLKLVIPPTWQMQTSLISRLKPQVERQILTRIQKPVMMHKALPSTEAQHQDISPQSLSELQPPMTNSEDASRIQYGASVESLQSHTIHPSWKALALMVWLGGMVFFIGILIIKMSRLRKWRQMQEYRDIPRWFHELLIRTSQQLKLGKVPAIALTDDGVTPAVYGVFRPVLLLPKEYVDRLSREEAEHVLLHELCHLKRGDLWMHGICLVLQIVYWFNPLLIWTRRQMKHVLEICCDLSVANILREETKGYRDTLLNTAKNLLTETVEPGLGLVGFFEEPFRLVARLRWLEKKTWESRKQMLLVTVLSSLVVVACLMPMSEATQEAAVDRIVEIQADSQEPTDEIARLSDDDYNAKREEGNQDQIWKTMKYAGDPGMQIKIKELGPGRDILLPVKGSHEQHPKALSQLRDYIKKNDIPTRNRMFTVYNSNPHETIPSEYEWEVGCEIQADAQVSVERPFYVRDIFTGEYASCIIDESPDRELPWALFMAMTVSEGYLPVGPPIKSWNENPHEESRLPGKTEMLIPVVEIDNIGEGIAEWIESYGQVMKTMDPPPVFAPE